MKVFVYGTLKRGFHNHRCLEGAVFVKETTLTTPFWMYDTGGFPALLQTTEGKPGYYPTGEVFELPEGRAGQAVLARLDRLESEGYMYHRQEFYDRDEEIVSVYVGDPKVFGRYLDRPSYGRCIKFDDRMVTQTYVKEAA
jgi:gamma-glutamylcyclotransferase (GGCT)/AIG2-like uncharacterized protein YtfP